MPTPYLRKHIHEIESVQRRFTKKILGLGKHDYRHRLTVLNLPSLEFRRIRGDLIETYKICNNIYDPKTTNSLFDFVPSDNPTRSNGFKIIKKVLIPNNINTFTLTELLTFGTTFLLKWSMQVQQIPLRT